MNISNARYYTSPYQEGNNGIIAEFDGIELSVPLDPANRHYAEIMRQVEAGELVIQEADNG